MWRRFTTRPSSPSVAPLLDLPPVRELRYEPNNTCISSFNLSFNKANTANRNLKAAVKQVSGPVRQQECVRCRDNHNLWDIYFGMLGPACAGCQYNGQDAKCLCKYPYRRYQFHYILINHNICYSPRRSWIFIYNCRGSPFRSSWDVCPLTCNGSPHVCLWLLRIDWNKRYCDFVYSAILTISSTYPGHCQIKWYIKTRKFG